MKYHYRIREIRWNPESPRFIIQRTHQGWLSIKLGLADWYDIIGSWGTYPTIEAAKKEILDLIAADKAYTAHFKKTKTRYHYL